MIDKISSRQAFALLAAGCAAMLVFGLYLQHVVGLNPCPMCIVQRYALMLVLLIATLAAFGTHRGLHRAGAVLLLLTAGFGAFTAARQSWLQWFPPEFAMWGRDFYGMIENYPMRRAIPMIFKGSGDCAAVDWTLFGGSIANWSFVCFVLIGVLLIALLLRAPRRSA